MSGENMTRRIGDQISRHQPAKTNAGPAAINIIGDFMRRPVSELSNAVVRSIAVSSVALLIGVGAAVAQSGDLRAQDQQKQTAPSAADVAKDSQRKTDEFAEAAQAINGPAGNPECVWLGRRIVSLMWRDDLDTAFRHLDLYDRFGCPGGHVQAAFRCLTRFGASIDSKIAESLTTRVHACWINPSSQTQPSASVPPTPASPPAAAPAAPSK